MDEEVVLIKPEYDGNDRAGRLEAALEKGFAGCRVKTLETVEAMTGCDLRGRKIIFAVALVLTGGVTGVCIYGVGLASFFLYRHISMKYFGGTTGDLAGFFVTFSELLMLAAGVIAALAGH